MKSRVALRNRVRSVWASTYSTKCAKRIRIKNNWVKETNLRGFNLLFKRLDIYFIIRIWNKWLKTNLESWLRRIICSRESNTPHRWRKYHELDCNRIYTEYHEHANGKIFPMLLVYLKLYTAIFQWTFPFQTNSRLFHNHSWKEHHQFCRIVSVVAKYRVNFVNYSHRVCESDYHFAVRNTKVYTHV
jgi:hypothetical protein